MGVEVELKARVDNPDVLSRTLDRLGSFQRRYDKRDRYFGFPDDPVRPLFRLRRDDNTWLCTFKKKQIREQTEQNDETEFEVSDDNAFCRFAQELGYEVVVEKRKIGAKWIVDGITVELSDVNDIGAFVELEIVLPDDSSDHTVNAARARLFSLFARLEIPPSALESRPYTQIIYENTAAPR